MFIRKTIATVLIFAGFSFAVLSYSKPVYAVSSFLYLNVTPSNISFNITNPEAGQPYYTSSQKINVVSYHNFTWLEVPLRWYVGIRAGSQYLVDSMNPNNKIPVSQLRWSRDGANFYNLSEIWSVVNTYREIAGLQEEEKINYRLYPDGSLPAGLYTIQIEFDARWWNLPWD